MQNQRLFVAYKRKKVDYLKIRLQRMVRALLREESRKRSCCYLTEDQHPFIKVLSITVLLVCVTLFLYQTYDRTAFYFTYPVTTDVFITKKQYQILPELTICYQESERLFEYYKRLKNKWCATLPSAVLLKPQTKIPMEEIWKVINSTKAIASAKEISISKTEDLTFSSIPLIYGTCTTFRSTSQRPVTTDNGRFEIIFNLHSDHMCWKKSMSSVFVHEPNEIPQSRKLHTHGAGVHTDVGITITQVKFLNRTGSVCTSAAEYKKCHEDCFLKYSLENAKCRFPFHPETVSLRPCDNFTSKYTEWLKMEKYFIGQVNETCHCKRKCQHRTFDVKDIPSVTYENMTKVVLKFDDPHETEVRERYIYDLIKLLSDIGGNSGLYIGVSILSLFEFIPTKRKKVHTFTHLDPLYFKVIRTYNLCRKSKMCLNPQNYNLRIPSTAALVFKYILLLLCFGAFAFGIVNRTLHYLQYPVRNIVDISFNTSLETPSPTICPGDKRVLDLQTVYARKHNFSDICEIKKWQLLELPGINATYLWINPKLIAKNGFWAPATPAFLQDGTCASLDHGKRAAASNWNVWVYSNQPALCGKYYKKVYLRPPTGYYDYFQYRYIINKRLQQIMVIVKEIKIDLNSEACISEDENAACNHKCLTNKLWRQVQCRLPYMPPATLPMCKTPASAKHSYLTYWELFTLPSNSKDCNCLPPCRKRFYETRVSAQKHLYSSFSFGASHNVVESYTKIRSYTLVALLSDIGGWLGSTLGLCIFTTFHAVFTCSSRICQKCVSLKRFFNK